MTTDALAIDHGALGRQLEYGLTLLNIPFNQSLIVMLLEYLSLLQKWNRVHNLTAVREPEKMLSAHLLDCLSVLPHIPDGQLLDVGTGGGLPGIPLAAANPNLQVTLIEANQKKAAFLRQAVSELKLSNAVVVCQKVEQWLPENTFTCIISRAYAEIAKFIESSRHLLADNGIFAAMKGRYPRAEINVIPQGFAVKQLIELKVPGLDAERHLVLIGRA